MQELFMYGWDVEFRTMQLKEVTRKHTGKEERERGLGLRGWAVHIWKGKKKMHVPQRRQGNGQEGRGKPREWESWMQAEADGLERESQPLVEFPER